MYAVQISMPMPNIQRDIRDALCATEQKSEEPGNRVSGSSPIYRPVDFCLQKSSNRLLIPVSQILDAYIDATCFPLSY